MAAFRGTIGSAVSSRGTANVRHFRNKKSAGFEVNMRDVRNVQRTLKYTGDRISKDSYFEAAKIVANEARKEAPVGKNRRRGSGPRLNRSIRIRRRRNGGSTVVAKQWYAHMVHFGTGDRESLIGYRGRVKANPFIYRAQENKHREILAAYDRRVDQIIREQQGRQVRMIGQQIGLG